jgi:hypothetical protein
LAPDLITLAILGVGGYVLWKSGILSNIGGGGSAGGDAAGVGSPPPAADPGTTTPPASTPPGTTPPATNPPTGGNDTCHSVYNGSCNVECQSGATQLCQTCLIACGQGSLPPTGSYPPPPVTIPPQPTYPPQYPYPYPPQPVPVPTTDPNRCHSVYNGSCHTECSSGSSSQCNACKAACGPNSAYARMTSTAGFYAAIQNSKRRQMINSYYAQARIPPIAIA